MGPEGIAARGAEGHGDVEAAAGPGVCGDLGVVGVGDSSDDGEAESVPIGMADALAAGFLERLEEPVDLAGRDSLAGVGDGDDRAARG